MVSFAVVLLCGHFPVVPYRVSRLLLLQMKVSSSPARTHIVISRCLSERGGGERYVSDGDCHMLRFLGNYIISSTPCTLLGMVYSTTSQLFLLSYDYFLRAAEMCAYLHALQNRIFRLVILSDRRRMDCMRSIPLAKRILAFQSHVL